MIVGKDAVDRPRGAQGRPEGPQAQAARRSATRGRVAGRRPDGRDRQPVRPRPHAHDRRRLRAAAPDHGARRLRDRERHPDRRGDQPRQLRRPAARRGRPRDRHQLADRDRRRTAAGSVGIGFAVPIDTAKQVVAAARRRTGASTAVASASTCVADRPGGAPARRCPSRTGVLVQAVRPGGARRARRDHQGRRPRWSRSRVGRRQLVAIGGDVRDQAVDGSGGAQHRDGRALGRSARREAGRHRVQTSR